MLLPYDRLLKTPVMSLQTGAELAVTSRLLVDPRNLTIIAYELDGPMLDEHPSFLRPLDVRELSKLGLIVDSSDEFIGLEDVIAVSEVYGFNFELIGLDVIDDTKHRLGKIHSYTLDSGSFAVQQIAVKRPLLRSFNDTELLIHRSQIIEVRDDCIQVRSNAKTIHLKESLREYANPFRAGSAQPETIDR